jgi:hypothetical protein
MKNSITLILLVIILILVGYIAYTNSPLQVEYKPESTDEEENSKESMTRPNKKPNLNLGILNLTENCKEKCDTECESDRNECDDTCDNSHNNVCEQASIALASCNHNCQFIPIPPGPGPCWNKCQEEFNKQCDDSDLKDCKNDCKQENYTCTASCYTDC